MTYIVAISAYLVLLTIFGLIVARKKVKTSDDMVTGGHRIPFIILVGTLLATWCGGGGITGSASVVYTGGPWVGLITFAAPPIGIILLYFIAARSASPTRSRCRRSWAPVTVRPPASSPPCASCWPMWACWPPS
ncbi:MAG: hypothetical protein EP146_15390 [Oscillibacter sp.]|uniref:hypothetical protein n=1 Tax=Oscillibacter sp. TaxID=1945593 RepID=UPI001322A141|nr:hypothetical protein [Oscillibacter sp.]MUU12700.1 hypothetical protein [Oscillibacter sp.]